MGKTIRHAVYFLSLLLTALALSPQPLEAATYTVKSGGTHAFTESGLQTAINAAAAGDEIRVAVNEGTLTGEWKLPLPSGCAAGQYVTIRADTADSNLPMTGQRITLAYEAVMPKLVSGIQSEPTFRFKQEAPAGGCWRFLGIWFAAPPLGMRAAIEMGGNDCPSGDGECQQFPGDEPHDIEVDRSVFMANPYVGWLRGIMIGASRVRIINNHFQGIYGVGQDAQCIALTNGYGDDNNLIENNWMQCGAYGMIWGGSSPGQYTRMTISGTPTTTTAIVTGTNHNQSGDPHSPDECSIGQHIAFKGSGGTQRYHTTLTNKEDNGDGTWDYTFTSVGIAPDTGAGSDLTCAAVTNGWTFRRNVVTKDTTWWTSRGLIPFVTGLTSTPQTGTGTLPAATYTYNVVAVNKDGFSGTDMVSDDETITCVLSATGQCKLDWTPPVAESYTHQWIYGRTPGGLIQRWEVAKGTATFTDDNGNGTIANVTGLTTTPQVGTGTLAAGTYTYHVVAVDTTPAGNDIVSSGVSVQCVLSATGQCKIDWTGVAGAELYWVYGRTGSITTRFEVTAPTVTRTDSGSAGTFSTAVPGAHRPVLKNSIEVKCAQNVLIERNIFQFAITGSDLGYHGWFKSSNQEGRGEACRGFNITVRLNLFRWSSGAFSMSGQEEFSSGGREEWPEPVTNLYIHDNLVCDSGSNWDLTVSGGDGANAWGINFQNGTVSSILDHNTILHDQNGFMAIGGSVGNRPHVTPVITNNIGRRNTFGVFAGGAFSEGTSSLNGETTGGYVFEENIIDGINEANYPANNHSDSLASNLVDPTSTTCDPDDLSDYALQSGSPFKAAGTDGEDLGADIEALEAALVGVEQGNSEGEPPPAADPPIIRFRVIVAPGQ